MSYISSMSAESRPGGLGKHRLPDRQRRKTGREIFWYGAVGTLASTALVTGAMYAIDGVSTFSTNLVNDGLHLLPFGWQIPNIADSGINALGGAINTIPHANVLPNLAAEHFSGISSNPNFWGMAEGMGALAGASRGLILGYEIGKRQLRHSAGVVGESILPGAARLKKTVDSASGLAKTGNAVMKTTEIGASFITPGSPIGFNDLYALAFVLTGYRPGKGIMTAADLVGMSILLATPFPTVTTWDILKGAVTRVTSVPKHVKTIGDHVDRVRK